MLKNKIKTFSVLALVSVLAISLSLFGLSLDKPRGFVFAAEAETSSSGESTTEETAVAKIGEKTYSSLSAAVEAAEAGDTVTLVADTEDNVVVSKDLTIDLGDYTVSNASKGDSEVIKVTSGTLVLNANKGGVYGGSGANYVAICTISGSIVINGGNYSIGGDKNGLANPTVYIYGSGNVTINGGTFSSEKPYNGRYYVLNILNKKGNGTFVVTGGTFINCNPADGDDNLHGNFVAEGYVSVDNGDESYTVKKVIAKVGENSYASLAEAVAAAKDGDTVTLVADTAENVTINKSLKLDLGDYTLYSGAKDVVLTVKSGNVVINADKGGVRGGSGSNNVAIMVTEGNITINGGNYYVGGDANGDGNSTIYIAGSGNVTITGGNFETEKAWEKFYYVLNIQNDKTGTFVVTGGTFKNYNPAVGDDNKGGNFVAEGYNVLEDTTSPDYTKYEVINGVFKVTKVGGEKVGYYNTLEEAIEAAPEKGYIYLANDYTASASVYDLSGKVLRLNNYTLTCSEGTSFVGENAGITWGNVVGENGSYALIIGKEDYKTDNFKISVGNYCGIKIQNATNVTLDGCNIEAPAEYALSLGENVTVVVGGYNTSSFKTGAKGFFACEKGSKLTIENNVFLTGDGKFFVNLGGELVVSADAKKLLEEKFAEVVANYVFVTTETEGYYSVIEKSTLKEYLVNLGTSITLKVSVNEVGKNVKVTYAYGDDEVEIVKHTDGFYYIENITPQIIDRVYTVKVYEGETVVDSKELSVLGYCDTLLGTTTASEEAKAAVKALVFYGKAAKEFLGIKDTTAIDEVVKNHNLAKTELEQPEYSATSTGENLISKVTLNVSDVNAIVYAMTAENYETVYGKNSGYTITIGGETISADKWIKDGDLYVYTGADIYASELGNQVKVVIKNGETEVQTLVYGVYDYCANKWETDGVSGIAKAIYAYGVACKNYADGIKVKD